MERDSDVARDLDRLFNLDGKAAIVIGAASGIGKASAKLLAEAGANVVVADCDQRGTETVASDLIQDGGSATPASVDVTSEESVQALFESQDEVDVVVNCVGVYPKTPLLETTTDEWDGVHAVNLKGAFLCVREAGRSMMTRARGGSIVNVSSISSLHPAVIGNAAYGASKGGLNVLTKTAALELGPHDIRVNSVLPGGTLTEGALRPSPVPRTGPILGAGRVLMGRMAQPLEIAAGILFLATPASSYMTGQTLVLDGGFLVT
jgi:NAD(P)-dependent dehydrogenase (short-subunit alcohol dehydrogenase family)